MKTFCSRRYVLLQYEFTIIRLTLPKWHHTIVLVVETHLTNQLRSAGSNPVGTAKSFPYPIINPNQQGSPLEWTGTKNRSHGLVFLFPAIARPATHSLPGDSLSLPCFTIKNPATVFIGVILFDEKVNITLDHTTLQKGVVAQPTRRDPISRTCYSKKEYGHPGLWPFVGKV